MDLPASQETLLHYAMLEYVYDKQQLPKTCFTYFWEDFKDQNKDRSNLQASLLKTVFWKEVMPNVTSYLELLDPQMKNYFEKRFLDVDENFEFSLLNNEPLANRRDFERFKSPKQDREAPQSDIEDFDDSTVNEMYKQIRNVFNNPKTCLFEDDDVNGHNANRNCIIVTKQQLNHMDESDDIEGNLIKTFNAVLRTKNDHSKAEMLSNMEVLKILQGEDVASDPDYLVNLPTGVKYFKSQFPVFKHLIERSDNEENGKVQAVSSLDIPGLSMESGSQKLSFLTDNSSNIQRSLRLRGPRPSLDPTQAKRALAVAQHFSPSTRSRKPRSKKKIGCETFNQRENDRLGRKLHMQAVKTSSEFNLAKIRDSQNKFD